MAGARWTEERSDRLSELWALGWSTREIANDLGTTKNAVIGRADRMDLAERRPSPTHAYPRCRAPAARPASSHPPARPPAVPEASGSEPIPFSRLDPFFRLCRWDLGEKDEAGERLYCGDAVAGNSNLSFCPHHLARAKTRASL